MSTNPTEGQPDHDKLHPSDRPAWTKEPYDTPQASAPEGYAPQSPYGQGQQHQQQPHQQYQQQQPYQQQYQQPYQPGYAGGPQGYPGGPGGPWAPQDPNAKSRMAAGLLGIFLGTLGIHRFYLGYTGIGLVMLLASVLSFGFLTPVTGIWGLVEGILYLTDKTGSYSRDATGRPLRD